VPGTYELILTVDGQVRRESLAVKLDPRVHIGPGDLEAQLEAARMIDDWMNISYRAYNLVTIWRAALAKTQKEDAGDGMQALDKELADLQEGTSAAPGFGAVNRDVTRFVSMIQNADMRPAKSIIENATPSCVALKNDLKVLRQIVQTRFSVHKIKPLPVPDDPRCPNQ
jgi:hypothetical protein